MFCEGKSKKFLLWLLNQTAIRDKRDVWEATKRCFFFGSEKVLNFSEWKESNEILMKEFLVRLNDETFLFNLQSFHSLFSLILMDIFYVYRWHSKRVSRDHRRAIREVFNQIRRFNEIEFLVFCEKKCKKPAENLSPLLLWISQTAWTSLNTFSLSAGETGCM